MQLPPQLAEWIKMEIAVEAVAIRDLGLRDASDKMMSTAARDANAILMSKDSNFIEMVMRLGSPPKLLSLNCGNMSNAA